MAVASRRYDVFTDDQKRILSSFYDKGMNTTSKNMHGMMLKAADEVGTSLDKVKKWIGNEKRKRKIAEGVPEQMAQECRMEIKGPPLKRMASGYNLFSSQLLTSDECKAIVSKSDKMKLVASKWQALGENGRKKWQNDAKEVERMQPSTLSIEERRKQITKAKKSIAKELSYLECLGCELAVVMIEPESGMINQFGSTKGTEFLLQNETLALKFRDFFDCPKDDIKYTRCDVQDLFNKKYSEACGIPGTRCTYEKGCLTVTGLPPDTQFKKPSGYGADQLNKIMKNKDNILFHLTPKTNVVNICANTSTELHKDMPISPDIKRVLCKVVDEEVIVNVVTGTIMIEEKDLEVTDLYLTEEEFQCIVTTCSKYFSEDALKSLTANYESCCKHEGYILPIYTTSTDPYWLFYYPGKMSSLQGLQQDTKISGYWFNVTDKQSMYELMLSRNKFSVKGISIINRLDNETPRPMFWRQQVVLRKNSQIIVPEHFHNSVINCLKEQGFL